MGKEESIVPGKNRFSANVCWINQWKKRKGTLKILKQGYDGQDLRASGIKFNLKHSDHPVLSRSMILSWGKYVSFLNTILENEKIDVERKWMRWTEDEGKEEKIDSNLLKRKLTEII